MKNFKLLFFFLILLPNFIVGQINSEFTTVKTRTTDVKISGKWVQLNTSDDSGQTYYKNSDGIIIAIAQNPKKMYSFFSAKNSDFENVKLFYSWDSDYRKEEKMKTVKLKENAKLEYVIWKFHDEKLDNVFLFGSVKDNFLNLLVYTDKWSENEKIEFLESTYKLNK
ncbi:MAG: hypothetical protein H7239_07480 [Flavobacterium sp.]|nr:hypothetical protein [Flavobacterium sp.]